MDINPGVAVGQVAEYNITRETDSPSSGSIDLRPYWFKIEIIEISGKNVTIRLSAKDKDGLPLEGSGETHVCDIESGAIDGMFNSVGILGVKPRFLLMSADVSCSVGQELFEYDPFGSLSFERSEMRTYLGFSRSVNVFTDTTSSSYGVGNKTVKNTITETIVFDKASGIVLEAEVESRNTEPEEFLVLRTNSVLINHNGIIPEFPSFVVLPLLMIAVAFGALLYRKKISKPILL